MKTFISVFLFAVVSFYFQPAMAEHPTLTIASGWSAMNAPVIIAQEKGFFKEQGLKTTIIYRAGSNRTFQAYVQGNVDATTTNCIPIVRSNFDASHHVIIGTLT